ncbi:MAG: transglycosylase domain-containing protein [Anaerolineae bacterium]|nr:transglycosylase domain-containing protein [Anaerolineae bacterium]
MYSRFDDDNPERQSNTPSQQQPETSSKPTPPQSQSGVPTFEVPIYAMPQAQPQSQAKTQPRRIPIGCLGCAVALLGMFVTTICSLAVGALVVWNTWSREISDQLQKKFGEDSSVATTGVPANTFQTTYIYDRNGNELHEVFGEGRRTRVKLSEISPYLIDATIAVEDSSFYENSGFDVPAIARAFINFVRGRESGGASTITQQLIRNVVFDFEYRAERSARRKLEEVVMAQILTQQMPKDEILELYLNIIYYGNLAYGIEAAAQTYFGKSAKDLTLAEAALIAGLPQSPANYDPFNPDPAVQATVLDRRNIVLNLMVEKGKISKEEAEKARRQALVYADPSVNLRSPHFTLYAEEELRSLLEALNLPATYLNTGGLKVYTTLDTQYQELAESVARAQIETIKAKNNANNAAVVILKPGTGEILAMMGSVNYRDDSIDGRVNMAISPRQPGSAMKPLTYAAAMERGISPAAIFWDVETHIKSDYGGEEYVPLNYDRNFHGPVRMRTALANSYNVPAVKALRLIGVDYFLNFAQRMGVRSLGTDTSQYGLALTLGGGALTELELTQAYSVFANDGKLIPATSILCVINNDNQIVYQYENGCAGRGEATDQTINSTANGQQVIDPRIAFLIRDFLGDNAARTPAMGSNSPLRTDGIRSSVKTGTTNDFRDNWTVGFTKSVAVGVWVGNTDNKEMQNTTGLTGAAPIWNQLITGIYSNPGLMQTLAIGGQLPNDELFAPQGLTMRRICSIDSVREPALDCDMSRSEYIFDSPPLSPDPNGDLTQQSAAFAPTPLAENGPQILNMDADPGVVRALVFRINPALAASMVNPNPAPGEPQAPPPLYCLVPREVAMQYPGVTEQVFIQSPVFADEDVYVRLYAQSTGYAILPQYVCSADLLNSGPGVQGVFAQISAPRSGETVTGTVHVYGTASWGAGQAWYFKMEIQGPQFPEWTTFSGPTEAPVINGELGNFGAAGLVPGMYQLRIVVVGMDGNYLQISGAMPINITG